MNPLNKYNEIPPFADSSYEPKTTFWGDFGVADCFYESDSNSINDTFKRSFNTFKDDKIYGTELAMVLNHKAWEHYNKENYELAKLYTQLYEKLDQYIMNNWSDDDLKYYLKTTD